MIDQKKLKSSIIGQDKLKSSIAIVQPGHNNSPRKSSDVIISYKLNFSYCLKGSLSPYTVLKKGSLGPYTVFQVKSIKFLQTELYFVRQNYTPLGYALDFCFFFLNIGKLRLLNEIRAFLEQDGIAVFCQTKHGFLVYEQADQVPYTVYRP